MIDESKYCSFGSKYVCITFFLFQEKMPAQKDPKMMEALMYMFLIPTISQSLPKVVMKS